MARREEVGLDITARNMASRELAAVGQSLGRVGDQAEQTSQKTSRLGGMFRNLTQGVMMGVGMQAFNMTVGGVGSLGDSIIGMNAQLEKSTLQFETLFRDADRAKTHVAMLFEFAKKTPFETGPIIEASRLLQTFGGDALNTQQNLTMIGDAAAGASVDINEVSFWVGRAYAAIQGGQPFGEARMRLQELALLTPEAAQKMEKLQKAGASTAEVWSIMEGELGRFSGAMEKQAGTWDGLVSTFADTVKLTLAGIFKPVFEALKGVLGQVNNFLSSPAAAAGFKAFGDAMVGIFALIGSVISRVWDMVEPIISTIVDVLTSVFGPADTSVKGFRKSVEDTNPVIATLTDFVRTLSDALTSIVTAALAVYDAIFNLIGIFTSGEASAASLGEAVGDIGERLVEYWAAIANGAGAVLDTVLPIIADLARTFVEWIGPLIPPMLEQLGQMALAMLTWVQTTLIPQVTTAIGVLAGKFYDWVTGSVLPMLAVELPKMLEALVAFLTSIIPPLAAKLLEVATEFVKWVGPQIPLVLAELTAFFNAAVKWLAETGIPLFFASMVKFGKELIAWVAPKIGPLLAELLKVLIAIGQWVVTSGIPSLISAMVQLAGAILTGFKNVLFGQNNGGDGLLDAIVDFFFNQLIPGLLGLGVDMLETGADIAGDFVQGIIDAVLGAPGAIGDAIGDMFRNINVGPIGPFSIKAGQFKVDWPDIKFPTIEIPGLAVGSWNIPRDMPAYLHAGEMVVPKDIASVLRGARTRPQDFPKFPSAGVSAGRLGGGAVIVNVSYAPMFSTGSPSEQSEAARTLGDLLVDEFRNRGLIPEMAGSI